MIGWFVDLGGTSADMSSMYKSSTSQSNPGAGGSNIYGGGNPNAQYMQAHAGAHGHLIQNQQHLMQSQLGVGAPTQVRIRGTTCGSTTSAMLPTFWLSRNSSNQISTSSH